MNEAGLSRSIPFKSKKRLLMDSSSSKSLTVNPNPSNVALSTPEKPAENILTRCRNRSVALSVKEIRQAAASRRRYENPTVKVSSAKRKLLFPLNAENDKLPEKYEILGKFFDALDSSIVLSKLRGSKLTFFNIKGKVEQLTERRFCYSHLAQLKHILPEAMEIKRVLIYDERTSCMKPDLHITLNPDAVEYNDKSSKKIALRKVFRARLAEFVKAHPQGDEVPEDPLPELYSTRKPNEDSTTPIKRSSSQTKPILSDVNIVATPVKPLSLMARKQKRSNDYVSTDPPAKLVRRSLSLNLDSSPDDESSDDEILSILPDKLRQSIREQERKAKRRRRTIACLPKLFDVIHYLIQSIRRWVITKKELVHKIIAGHSVITDTKEVEQQLTLMQELVPEWMSEKKSSCGDLLVCINKFSSPQTTRSRLQQVYKEEIATTPLS